MRAWVAIILWAYPRVSPWLRPGRGSGGGGGGGRVVGVDQCCRCPWRTGGGAWWTVAVERTEKDRTGQDSRGDRTSAKEWAGVLAGVMAGVFTQERYK